VDAGPIDNRALNDLKTLGGDDFVSEIVDQFLGDAAGVLKNLHSAVAQGDVQKFRDEAHALRSCAANVGAQKVYKLCLDWRAIDARELAIEGEMRIRRLETEFERARDALALFRRVELD
jgi:two-component system sensor histidine kinase RpfC